MRLLQYAEALDHTAAFALNKLGVILYEQGDLQGAEVSFTNAVGAELSSGSALNNLGVTYFMLGQFQPAHLSQQRAVQSNPDSAIARYNLGLILMQQNLDREAIRQLRESSYIDPTWDLPHLQLAYIFVRMQNFVAAEQEAKTTVSMNPAQQPAHVLHAISLYHLGRDEDALAAVDHALQIAPQDDIARFYRALILARLNRSDAALSTLWQLLDSTNDPQKNSRIKAEIDGLNRSLQNP